MGLLNTSLKFVHSQAGEVLFIVLQQHGHVVHQSLDIILVVVVISTTMLDLNKGLCGFGFGFEQPKLEQHVEHLDDLQREGIEHDIS